MPGIPMPPNMSGMQNPPVLGLPKLPSGILSAPILNMNKPN